MSDTPVEPVAADPAALPRPEEEVADGVRDNGRAPGDVGHPEASGDGSSEPLDPRAQPAAGGTDDGPAAQGDGAADSY